MILGLDRYDINEKALKKTNPSLVVNLKFKYPDAELMDFSPKKRQQKLKKILKGYYQKIQTYFPNSKPLGQPDLFFGAEVRLKYRKLKKVQKLDFIEWIRITEVEGMQKKKEKKIPDYYTVVASLVIDVEGEKKKKLSHEMRMMLVKASSGKAAKKKVKKKIQAYEEPYLNGEGKRVHWQFQEIMDCYETTIGEAIKLKGQDGIELYSKIFKNEKAMRRVIKEIQR
ncbi:MAG: DUF4288 domain-containing protein [Bacteroidota bacterium]